MTAAESERIGLINQVVPAGLWESADQVRGVAPARIPTRLSVFQLHRTEIDALPPFRVRIPVILRSFRRTPAARVPGSSQFRKEFAADSPLEEAGFELSVLPRRESLCGATPGKHRRLGPEPVGGSAFSCRRLRLATPRREPSQERDRWFESGFLHRTVWSLAGIRLSPSRSRGFPPVLR